VRVHRNQFAEVKPRLLRGNDPRPLQTQHPHRRTHGHRFESFVPPPGDAWPHSPRCRVQLVLTPAVYLLSCVTSPAPFHRFLRVVVDERSS
jgi:hypothetical protein